MSYKEKLIGDMKNIQGGFDKVCQGIGQARQEVMEIRIKLGNGKIKPEELSKIFDKIINILLPEVEREIQDVIEEMRCLQGELVRY